MLRKTKVTIKKTFCKSCMAFTSWYLTVCDIERLNQGQWVYSWLHYIKHACYDLTLFKTYLGSHMTFQFTWWLWPDAPLVNFAHELIHTMTIYGTLFKLCITLLHISFCHISHECHMNVLPDMNDFLWTGRAILFMTFAPSLMWTGANNDQIRRTDNPTKVKKKSTNVTTNLSTNLLMEINSYDHAEIWFINWYFNKNFKM